MKYEEVYPNCHPSLRGIELADWDGHKSPCPQLPGTILRIFIPAGAVINLLNLIELTSPSGICLILRLPFLGGDIKKCFSMPDLSRVLESVKNAGGTIEVVNQ